MGGEISIESELGQGARFFFTLPLEPSHVTVERKDLETSPIAGLRVLVVDDNATNREIVQHRVLSWKMRAASAGDAETALARLRQDAKDGRHYDIAILDMHMPQMDGPSWRARSTRTSSCENEAAHAHVDRSRRRRSGAPRAGVVHLTSPCGTRSSTTGSPRPAERPACGASRRRALRTFASPGLVLLVEDNPVNQEVAKVMLELRLSRAPGRGQGAGAARLASSTTTRS
jgi:CheY-like chemotaxis protein